MLGVEPGASHDEVKRAYTTQALRWHPDRRSELDGRDREQAEWRMRELNAAWSVLRSPGGRADYDDELRRTGLLPPRHDPADAGPQAGRARPSVPLVGAQASDQLVEPVRVGQRPAASPSHVGRWVAGFVVVALVVGGVIAAIAAAVDDQAPSDPQVHTGSYAVGSCILLAMPGPTVITVDCSTPHAMRLASTTDYPRPCPTGTEELPIVDEQLTLCLTTP